MFDGVEVFSLSTDLWKEVEYKGCMQEVECGDGRIDLDIGPLHHIQVSSQAVNVSGTLIWMGWGIFPVLISFDIAMEVFTTTPMPAERGLHPIWHSVYENKLEGHYVIEEEPGSGSHFIGVWVMEKVAAESGKSWSITQKYRIGPLSFSLYPVCIWRNEIVCRSFETEVDGEPSCDLHLFNLITNEGRKYNCSVACDWCDIFNYERSLVSVWNAQVE